MQPKIGKRLVPAEWLLQFPEYVPFYRSDFGNPGSTEMPLIDALVDAPDIAYVLGLQEATAVGRAPTRKAPTC
jgi:hypothetical protein